MPTWPEDARKVAIAALDNRAMSDGLDISAQQAWQLVTDILDAAAPLLAEAWKPVPERLGYVVVTYDSRSRHPFVGFMHGSLGDATEARGGMSASPGERHVIAEVFEVEENPHA